MSPRLRLFLLLWIAGFTGVLSFLLVDISALIKMLPEAEGMSQPDIPMSVIRLLAVIQPGVLVTLAVLAGMWLAPKAGLHAPATEALAERRPFFPALRPQIIPGIFGGILAGMAITTCWLLATPFLSDEFIARADAFNKMMPPITRFLYGGVTEEILLRWGMMTLIVCALWKAFDRGKGSPSSVWFVVSIVASAILFGAGHLPIASALSGGLTAALTIYVITANSIFGIAAGFLYWKRGLESAVIAHMFAHVVLLAAIALS
ncbi:MAG TPA: CPBP family glutamic-type intramembrane protease [Pyrinomonadaceae bacterium]|nr:CPBP family intramembrane metalloprotease [Chloracidobacterium sp.]HBE81826.1 CPBP family intramembrane metalloprotease [Blastocatellia bacterium]HRJ89836.1 CPBP family glutamic-type intramembrane protease [Pyrinomonadaceae bacterium]HRK51033.1 CPBP family glutamic-type intramembrane protease [Pyrinomonadaceae bacterium]